MDTYHAPDCGGTCDGCGWIGQDGLWHPGPCPADQRAYQQQRSEG